MLKLIIMNATTSLTIQDQKNVIMSNCGKDMAFSIKK